jgi:serine protease Do
MEQSGFSWRFFIACLAGSCLVGGAAGVYGFLYAPRLAASFGISGPAVLPAVPLADPSVSVVKAASPAVVSINISKEYTARRAWEDGYDDAFFEAPVTTSTGKRKLLVGGGSGFFVSEDGWVVTNRHVVDEKDADYTVVMQDGRSLPAKILTVDPGLDLAVLKVEGQGFPHLELGDSASVEVGQPVLAIGYALAEFRNSVTKGIVSGVDRRVFTGDSPRDEEVIDDAIQTDAAINLGNSGGPLLDLSGKVIGMNTAVSDDGQSLGFALPSNVLAKSLASIKKFGRVVRPWIGIRYVQVDEALAKEKALPKPYGVLIIPGYRKDDVAISPGSPAETAGLKEGDVVLSLDGRALDEDHALSYWVTRYAPGDTVSLEVWHEGKMKTVAVTLTERKEDR